MSQEIRLYAYSSESPQTSEATSALLSRITNPARTRALLVLPEYFLKGEPLFGGIHLTDPRISALEHFATDQNIHLVAGTILENEGRKTLTALFISPVRGIQGRYDKRNPTPFESETGIIGGTDGFRSYPMDGSGALITVVSCWDIWKEDIELRMWLKSLGDKAPQVIAHVRGFDLNDPRFGTFTGNWLEHFQDICRMTKTYGAAATGIENRGFGSMSEIISFEGTVLALKHNGEKPISAVADLDLLDRYRSGDYVSSIVPQF
jgi:hypothetical protein